MESYHSITSGPIPILHIRYDTPKREGLVRDVALTMDDLCKILDEASSALLLLQKARNRGSS
jgi:hypothetical protein